MFLMDMPDTAPQSPQIILVQKAQTSQSAPTILKANRIGVCALVESPIRIIQDDYSAVNSFGPIGAAITYLENFEGRKIQGTRAYQTTKVIVLMNPKHGTLKPMMPDTSDTSYVYIPNPDNIGSDRATFLVKVAGRELKIEYYFKVLNGVADNYTTKQFKQLCPKGELWKISSYSVSPTSPYES